MVDHALIMLDHTLITFWSSFDQTLIMLIILDHLWSYLITLWSHLITLWSPLITLWSCWSCSDHADYSSSSSDHTSSHSDQILNKFWIWSNIEHIVLAYSYGITDGHRQTWNLKKYFRLWGLTLQRFEAIFVIKFWMDRITDYLRIPDSGWTNRRGSWNSILEFWTFSHPSFAKLAQIMW